MFRLLIHSRLIILELLLLVFRGCEALWVSNQLSTAENWVFLTRFCYLSDNGVLVFDFSFPAVSDGSNLHILLYFDDQWPSVYKNNSMNCYQKESVLNPENNQIIYLSEREGWTGCSNPVNGTISCKAARSFASMRERWWYVVASRCGSMQGISLNYTLHLTNGNDLSHKEFSADEFYILEVDIAFVVAVFLLLVLSIAVAVNLRKKQLFHTTYKLYMVSLFFLFLQLLIASSAYGVYAQNGIPNITAKVMAEVMGAISVLVFLLLLILMGKGFTITRGRISTSGSAKLAVFMTLFTVTYVVLFIYQAVCSPERGSTMFIYFEGFHLDDVDTNGFKLFDPGLVLYLYQSPPGYGLLVLRLIGWLWFCYAIVFTLKHFPSKSPFYCLLFAFYTIWFWANPIAVLVANLAMAPWMREKVANGVFVAMAFCCQIVFLFITWPSRANANFPYHIRTTQIDFWRGGDEDALDSSTNGSNSMELRSSDSADGLQFTNLNNLFTVSDAVDGKDDTRKMRSANALPPLRPPPSQSTARSIQKALPSLDRRPEVSDEEAPSHEHSVNQQRRVQQQQAEMSSGDNLAYSSHNQSPLQQRTNMTASYDGYPTSQRRSGNISNPSAVSRQPNSELSDVYAD